MSKYLDKLSQKLKLTEAQRKRFETAVLEGMPIEPTIVWLKPRPNPLPFEVLPPLEGQPDFVDRLPIKSRPGKNPLHDQGYYYCLDYASVMMCLPLTLLDKNPEAVFDICAAPGGKSALAYVFLKPQTLLTNEVIGNRCGALISNLKRCEIPSIVMSRDTEVLKDQFSESVDLVIVDAPCSGQSLLVKKEAAPGCFHPTNVNKCMTRQRRIIANASAIVKPHGYLLYSTCTYSIEENEELCEWFLSKFSNFSSVEVPRLASHRSQLTDLFAYRYFPDTGAGIGGFTCLFQNNKEGACSPLDVPDSFVRWQFKK